MRRPALCIPLLIGFTLACGGDLWPQDPGSSGSPPTAPIAEASPNIEACHAYVEAYNTRPCVHENVGLNKGNICPESFALSPIDMTEYYQCMAAAMKCKGDRIDNSGQMDCKMPGL